MSIIVIVLTSGLVALGMAGYARIQRWCLYAGLIGLAIMFVLMLVLSQADFKSAFDRANQSLFGVSNAYDDHHRQRRHERRIHGDLDPFALGDDFGATLTRRWC